VDKYYIPSHLDDPELFGFWTLDEFLAMILPFFWGIIAGHIIIGIALGFVGWLACKKFKSGRSPSWIIHAIYWNMPDFIFSLKATPPSHFRRLVG
jgi:conjugal transfer pilus assembly protein TraL